MNNKLMNRLSMFDQVNVVLTEHRVLWETIPEFVVSYDKFNQMRTDLHDLGKKDGPKKWITEQKNEMLENSMEKGHFLQRLLCTYAVKAGNDELLKRNKQTHTEFFAGKMEVKLNRLRKVLDEIRNVLFELAPLGVSTQDADEFESAIMVLESMQSAPRNATVKRSVVVGRIKLTNEKTVAILELELDVLVMLFSKSQPMFVKEYNQARIVVDFHGKRKSKDMDNSPERDDGDLLSDTSD